MATGRMGRPRSGVPEATAVVTRRIRLVIDQVHDGNVRAASKASNVAYATLRDLYSGKNTSPAPSTLAKLDGAYGVLPKWFTDPAYNDELPRSGVVFRVKTGSTGGADPQIRNVVVPYTAWPLPDVYRRLTGRLAQMPPLRTRPIVGDSQGDEFLFRLCTFLLQPLLNAEAAGTAGPFGDSHSLGAKSATYGSNVRQMKLLGRFWEDALGYLLR